MRNTLIRNETIHERGIVRKFLFTKFLHLCSLLILTSVAVAGGKLPIKLSVEAPGDLGRQGVLATQDWELVFRLEVNNAVALVAEREPGGSPSAIGLVIDDPDNCIHMGDFFPTDNSSFEEGCTGHDETWISFLPHGFNLPGLEQDHPNSCAALVDDPSSPSTGDTNKSYLTVAPFEGGAVSLQGVGPETGGETIHDCYGYGAHEFLPGLVVMADVGGARVFDVNFNRSFGPRIRNMAGLLNHIDYEFLGKGNITTVRAGIRVLNSFEPITLIDASVDDPDIEFVLRHESGPMQNFKQGGGGPAPKDITARLAVNPLNEVTVRAVIVNDRAPDHIDDMDGDGEYTSADLELAGYTVVSNEIQFDVLTKVTEITDQRVEFCKAAGPFVYVADLDGNGSAGGFMCGSLGTGSSRSGTRIRR